MITDIRFNWFQCELSFPKDASGGGFVSASRAAQASEAHLS